MRKEVVTTDTPELRITETPVGGGDMKLLRIETPRLHILATQEGDGLIFADKIKKKRGD